MKIGIFWYFDEEVIGRALPLKQGIDTGDFLDSPINHFDYWPALKAGRRELTGSDYIDVPRGRALYRKKDHRLVIYMDGVLFRGAIKTQVAKFFRSADSFPVFKRDEHYTTREADLEKLFSQ